MTDLNELHSSDINTRDAIAMQRLEGLGWTFKDWMGSTGVYNLKVNDGKTSWFHGDDSLTRAIRFASMAQAQSEARKEKR